MKHFRGKKLHLLDIQFCRVFYNLITYIFMNSLPLMEILFSYIIK